MRGIVAVLALAGLAIATEVAAREAQAGAQQSGQTAAQLENRPGSGHDKFVVDVNKREVEVTGTVVSNRNGRMVVQIDDHHHRIPFQLSSAAAAENVRPGSRVDVHYHPTGATGQEADAIQVLQAPRTARGRTRGAPSQ